ncbi:MAG: hypothetical protein IPP72_04300 [Chitinophagaceae bacterium]|nr:hypothetical protein [Chitinophagaceae bacterium]
MKIFYAVLFSILLFCVTGTLSAQQKEMPVRFVNGDFITGSNISKGSFKKEDISNAAFGADYYVLVQFSKIPSTAVMQKMKDAGIRLSTFLPGNAYLASIKNSFDFSRARSFTISSINAIPVEYKIHNSLQSYQPTSNKEEVQAIAITYFNQS